LDWFRTYHGTATDPKWLAIARAAKSTPAVAHSVWMAMLDRASQARPRGSAEGLDCDALAAFYGVEPEEIEAIRRVMRDRGMLTEDGWIATWGKRQPKREDDSAERVREHRKRIETPEPDHVTQRNAPKRSGTHPVKGRGEDIIDSEAKASDAPAGAVRPMTIFDTGEAWLTSCTDMRPASARSLIAKLCTKTSDAAVTAAIEEMRARPPPAEPKSALIEAVTRHHGKPNGQHRPNRHPDADFGDRLRTFAAGGVGGSPPDAGWPDE